MTFWFVMQQAACLEAFKNAGASQVSYLPLAADPTIHQSVALTAEERQELGADVRFLVRAIAIAGRFYQLC